MRIGLKGPGVAFWRYRVHGFDTWFWGLCSVDVPEWWHWGVSLGALDCDLANGGHFDSLSLLRVRLGPVVIRACFIDDLGGGYIESPY